MDIIHLINDIKNDLNCDVKEKKGFPKLNSKHSLPKDLYKFYESCGGMSLFIDKEYGFYVLTPDEFILANPIIVGELCEEDISSEWYTICKDSENNFITIDLNPNRLGRCYDSFWDRHGVVGECSVIANCFTDLLYYLYLSKGKKLFWLDSNFQYIGDAYDE